ncbi:MAG TPA: Fe-Mn family superoxide dismutase, partial [Chroococcales cyanobacterium]
MATKTQKNVRTEIKPSKPLQGISKHQIDDHFDVKYAGYVNCFNQIEEKKQDAQPSGGPNFSEWREMMLEQERCFNAITLHEGYFQCLGGNGQPSGTIQNWLDEDFGSFDRWKERFTATGASARGWCVLAFSLSDGRLYNVLCDEHMIGLWNSVPLVILDMYEHAYYIDYNSNSKQYIQAYQNNLSFDFANRCI